MRKAGGCSRLLRSEDNLVVALDEDQGREVAVEVVGEEQEFCEAERSKKV